MASESVDIFCSGNDEHESLSHVYNLCISPLTDHMKISTGFSASQRAFGSLHSGCIQPI